MSLTSTIAVSRKHRFRIVIQAQKWRAWFSVLAVGFAVIGLGLTVASAAELGPLGPDAATTHPMTAVVLIWLAVGTLSFRRGAPTARLKYAFSMMLFAVCLGHAILSLTMSSMLPLSGARFGVMGLDTAAVLCLLLGALLTRRRVSHPPLLLLLAAVCLLLNAAIGRSYSTSFFGGHLGTMTILSLLATTASIITIFAPRPMVRVVFLMDEIGRRTRLMLAAAVVVPWVVGAVLFGAMEMNAREARLESLGVSLIILCMAMITIYSGHLNDRADQQRRLAERRLAQMALQDGLTGTLNRLGLSLQLDKRWAEFQDGGGPQGVILLDLDHFKRINDQFGHEEGDRVLAALGEALRPLMRRSDVVGRWGGEEFIILLDDARQADLPRIGERVREQVQGIAELVRAGRCIDATGVLPAYQTTVSVGVSRFARGDASPDDAIGRADAALYRAKDGGRNRVELDPAIAPPLAAA